MIIFKKKPADAEAAPVESTARQSAPAETNATLAQPKKTAGAGKPRRKTLKTDDNRLL
ncbi:hypothetical protein [Neomesorhizobium albiziae]|nr:hypothetical protein [Mesorhizobium albiziae]